MVSFVAVVFYIHRQPRTKSTGLVKLELASIKHVMLDPLIALFGTLLTGGTILLRRGSGAESTKHGVASMLHFDHSLIS